MVKTCGQSAYPEIQDGVNEHYQTKSTKPSIVKISAGETFRQKSRPFASHGEDVSQEAICR